MENQERLNKLTRKELATLIVEDQFKRGVVRNKDVVIKGYLKGLGSAKPLTKQELVNWVSDLEIKD